MVKMAATNVVSFVDSEWGAKPAQGGLTPLAAAGHCPFAGTRTKGGSRGAAASAFLNDERGQGLVEMAIIVVLFVLLSMGIIEFGRAFMLGNMVTHAARDGARAAAVIGTSQRDANGIFLTNPSSIIETRVKNQIKTLLDAATADTFVVNVVQSPEHAPLDPGEIPVVTLAITGDIPYIFNLVGRGSFGISRTVTFRDEGRSAP
jgi:hypothetical protein